MGDIGAHTQPTQLDRQFFDPRSAVAEDQALLPAMQPGDDQRRVAQIADPVEFDFRRHTGLRRRIDL